MDTFLDCLLVLLNSIMIRGNSVGVTMTSWMASVIQSNLSHRHGEYAQDIVRLDRKSMMWNIILMIVVVVVGTERVRTLSERVDPPPLSRLVYGLRTLSTLR